VPLVKLVNITKKFGEIIALDNIELSIEDGEYLCVLGQTGAGKTTLLRTIAGLIRPDGGEIFIEGELVNDVPPEERDAVYMFQHFALFPHMNVWDNVSFGPSIKNWDNEQVKTISSEVLEMVRLSDRQDAFPSELSGGMQQRVALARGIASGAKILLLDEPLGALDARLRVDLRRQLRRLVKDQKLTAVHVTHDQEEALMTADRIMVLRKGKVEQVGLPSEIYSSPKSIFVASFVGNANFFEGNVIEMDNSGSTIWIRGDYQIRVSQTDRKVGDKVVVAVKPTDVIINPDSHKGKNVFSGMVDSSTFVGGSMKYKVIVGDGMVIFSEALVSNIQELPRPGQEVTVSFHPARCCLFEYPEAGLLKEIEAI
jgi:ABC-type Fe3+/spermidine/putrescine transport system ATPase subunit